MPVMPPSNSHRRTRSRLDAALSSPEPQVHDSSPSRQPSKKRKIQEVFDPKLLTSEEFQINSVIACLSMPSNDVMVALDHANDKNARDHRDGVTAYAKMSGQNWTFYVKDLRVVIGRPPDARPGGPLGTDTDVDIDLGPSKLVSRQHAIIEYDTTGHRSWVLSVLGRNGVKIDDEIHKRGSTVHLKSGNMLEIAGVQMLFFLPDQKPTLHPALLKKAAELQMDVSQDDSLQDSTNNALPSTASNSGSCNDPQSLSRLKSGTKQSALEEREVASFANMKSEGASFKGSPKPATTYHRSMMIESTEDVDYALDTAKDIKPPYSYATLIAQAILQSEEEKLTLAQIYAWIQDRYAFYRHAASGWQNSIRHNLSLNKAFQKIPRRTDEPGKGMKWQVADDSRDEFTKKAQRIATKGAKTSSQPSSPASDAKRSHTSQAILSSSNFSEDSEAGFPKSKSLPTLQRSVTPPSFVNRITQKEAYTPDRGSRKPQPRQHLNSHSVDEGHLASAQESRQCGRDTTPSSPYIDEEHDHSISASAVTPAPQKQHPMLAPPSITQQLPSSFLPTSSPAPFWKFMNLSTPARGNEFSSPIKGPALQSSSPPLASLGSRLRDVDSPITDRERASDGDIFATSSRANGHDVDLASTMAVPEEEDEVDDLQGFDLSKGFPSIGKYHAGQAAARAHASSGSNGTRR